VQGGFFMYNQSYEEYMRNVLGYNVNPSNTYNTVDDIYSNTGNIQVVNTSSDIDLDSLYPEIYKIVYPLVQRKCMDNNKTITKEVIDDMVDEIYEIVEPNTEAINVNINLTNTMGSGNKIENRANTKQENKNQDQKNSRQKNFLLNDLIKILLLRELTGNRRPNFNRPPRPPMRPPYPGRPPMPPMQPRYYGDEYEDWYERS